LSRRSTARALRRAGAAELRQRAVIDVPDVEREPLLPAQGVAPVDLGPPGYAGAELMTPALLRTVVGEVFGQQRARADQDREKSRPAFRSSSGRSAEPCSGRCSGTAAGPRRLAATRRDWSPQPRDCCSGSDSDSEADGGSKSNQTVGAAPGSGSFSRDFAPRRDTSSGS